MCVCVSCGQGNYYTYLHCFCCLLQCCRASQAAIERNRESYRDSTTPYVCIASCARELGAKPFLYPLIPGEESAFRACPLRPSSSEMTISQSKSPWKDFTRQQWYQALHRHYYLSPPPPLPPLPQLPCIKKLSPNPQTSSHCNLSLLQLTPSGRHSLSPKTMGHHLQLLYHPPLPMQHHTEIPQLTRHLKLHPTQPHPLPRHSFHTLTTRLTQPMRQPLPQRATSRRP